MLFARDIYVGSGSLWTLIMDIPPPPYPTPGKVAEKYRSPKTGTPGLGKARSPITVRAALQIGPLGANTAF